MTTATATDQLPLVTALPAEHLFDMHVDLQPAQPIPTPLGVRMTFITTGGVIEGPKLRGEVLPEAAASFARNELAFEDPVGCDHERLGPGLRKAVYNYMHGLGLDADPIELPKTDERSE